MVQLSINKTCFLKSGFILFALTFLALPVFSQETDSLKTDIGEVEIPETAPLPEDTTKVETFTANVGLGTGNFAFYGDVGKNFNKFNPFVSNLGYQIRISTAFSESIDLSFQFQKYLR